MNSSICELRSVVENTERNRLRNENENNYDEELLKVWNRLRDTYTKLKDSAIALLIFSSTYSCERLFSALNDIKTNKWNRLIGGACLALKCTKYKTEIEDLEDNINI